MSTVSRRYLSKVEQTFTNLLNYLEIQQNKPDPKSYLEKSTIRIICNTDGLTSIFLDHDVSRHSKPNTVQRFKESSVQLCRQIIDTLQSNERPFSLMHDQRFALDKPIALELFGALQTYAHDLGKDIHIADGKQPKSKILVIHPSTQESDSIARRIAFEGDIKSINMKLANEIQRIQRRRDIIDKYNRQLRIHTLSFADLTKAVLPNHTIKTSTVESRIAKEDILRYYTIISEIEQWTLEREYTNLLTQTRGKDLQSIYQQLYPLKELIETYWNARRGLTKNAPANMKSLEDSLKEYSYKSF